MDAGSEVKFPMMSEQKPGQIPGDVIVKLQCKKHATFRREKDNLYVEFQITLKEALIGFARTIPHLDGRAVEVREMKEMSE